MMSLSKKIGAECFGTFWLVLGGCGSAVFAGSMIGWAGVSLAFGLTVLTMAYAIGHISGCHLNPAVTIGLYAAGRFDKKEILPYIIAQVVGAIIATAVIAAIVGGGSNLLTNCTYAANGYGPAQTINEMDVVFSPEGYSLLSCIVAEVVLTFVFLMVILGATDRRAPAGFAPIAIGLCLTLIHLIGIPITNLSVNPARSTGPALFAGFAFVKQLWMFWLMPLLGAILAGLTYKKYFEAEDTKTV